jgi:outer membrane protein OmpA-like peptidoglycan-associated protein
MKNVTGFMVLAAGAMMAVAPVALGQSAPSQSDITSALRPVPSALAGGHQGLPSPGTAPLTQPPKPVYSSSYGGAPTPVAKERPHQTAATASSAPAADLAGCTSNAPAQAAASLPSITFEFGSAQLKPEAMATLQNLGKSLKQDFPDTNAFLIEGHTDAAGTFAYNQDLSRQRAEAVKAYLTEQMGIKPEQLATAGVGYCNLANPADPKGAENRRVVVVNKAS